MASQIMEIIIFSVQPIIISEGQSLLANDKWNNALSTLTQQNGVRTAYWGQTIEAQDKVYLFIDWISKQHCVDFKQSTAFATLQTNIDNITPGTPQSIYVPIAPHMYPRIFHDGVIEIAIFSSYNSSFIDTFARFSSIIVDTQGCTGIAKDIATNEILVDIEETGGSEELYVALIGWLDVATHRIAMETDAFKQNVPLIEECSRVITVYHIKIVMV
ncbi:uncharacterized protein TRIVIDRAFT_228239 [Trichoderma virens Gv29-8]|uniref:ABM domain-containing protein n=1 Tax=Hypocrea virens (strain Gv29-8 / FGSC 10586) TaxID=413071 RepID=G9NBW9_HYPVG|nr:uncharacterized protein TRIVIDRAFT_228239 [Trichoderma virens Gv29-8]EHK16322.1 hypothetical protein TRIVIDRAFT_228239 [Trichoderma virens Gv29-8]UKZ55903.1 hypothetical protein TrVGV298_009727 [Trichoderma virens]UKZ81652.1 hypothetical protein TrVFT333_009424 [Trichoderma virens FT-333]